MEALFVSLSLSQVVGVNYTLQRRPAALQRPTPYGTPPYSSRAARGPESAREWPALAL